MGQEHPSVMLSLTGRAGLFGERKAKKNDGGKYPGFGDQWELDPVTGQKIKKVNAQRNR